PPGGSFRFPRAVRRMARGGEARMNATPPVKKPPRPLVTAGLVALALPLWLALGVVLLLAVPRGEQWYADRLQRPPFPIDLVLGATRASSGLWVARPLLAVAGAGVLAAT